MKSNQDILKLTWNHGGSKLVCRFFAAQQNEKTKKK